MRRFVREGRQLRGRRTGIFGEMDVRMESMPFHSFCGIPLNTHYNARFFLDIPFLYLQMPLHAYGELMAKPNYSY